MARNFFQSSFIHNLLMEEMVPDLELDLELELVLVLESKEYWVMDLIVMSLLLGLLKIK